jgi:hypothetical protein
VGAWPTAFCLRWLSGIATWHNATRTDNVISAAWFTLGIYSFDGIHTVNVVAQLPLLC